MSAERFSVPLPVAGLAGALFVLHVVGKWLNPTHVFLVPGTTMVIPFQLITCGLFDDSLPNLLLGVPWTVREWSGPEQFEDPTGKLMMLPSDIVLIQDKAFRKYVVEYSKSNDLFFKDFSAATAKLFELGTSNLKSVGV